MDMITRLKSYQNGVHGDFFLSVAALLEQLQQDLRKARLGDHDYMQCVAAIRAANADVERPTTDLEALREEMKTITLALGRSKTDGESDCDWHDLAGEVGDLRKLADGLHATANGAFLDGRKNAEGEWRELERSYSQQLGEMARLSDVACSAILAWEHSDNFHQLFDEEQISAARAIMEYVEAVRPLEGSKDPDWVVHILGPDDVISCVSQFDALRKANQHNRQFAKLMAEDPSPNDPYCVALAKNRSAEPV